jgi:alkylated DNA repair dioxygenase AlkB
MSSLPPGIAYIDDFLSAEEEGSVAGRLDAGEWSTVLKRRVQHFGYLYDYKARTITKDAYLGKLPGWLEVLAERLVARASLEDMPD